MPTISTADFKNGLGLRIKDKVYTIEIGRASCRERVSSPV